MTSTPGSYLVALALPTGGTLCNSACSPLAQVVTSAVSIVYIQVALPTRAHPRPLCGFFAVAGWLACMLPVFHATKWVCAVS